MLVSVILPSRDNYEALKASVKYVLNQNYPHIEVIVVDDGSTDPRYQSIKWSGVRVIHLEALRKKGPFYPARGLNRGAQVARGKYIALCDQGDLWIDPSKITRQVQVMKKTGCGLSCTSSWYGGTKYEPGKKYEFMNEGVFWKQISTEFKKKNHPEWVEQGSFPKIWTYEFLRIHNCIVASTVLVEKELFLRVGSMPVHSRSGDYMCWFKILKHTHCAYVNKSKIYYDYKRGEHPEKN
jgi:glycosyltransferase involved in cell wall biosynthesis